MSIFGKYMDWRDRKMNGPRREAEGAAAAAGASPDDVERAGQKAERKRRLRASIGTWSR